MNNLSFRTTEIKSMETRDDNGIWFTSFNSKMIGIGNKKNIAFLDSKNFHIFLTYHFEQDVIGLFCLEKVFYVITTSYINELDFSDKAIKKKKEISASLYAIINEEETKFFISDNLKIKVVDRILFQEEISILLPGLCPTEITIFQNKLLYLQQGQLFFYDIDKFV